MSVRDLVAICQDNFSRQTFPRTACAAAALALFACSGDPSRNLSSQYSAEQKIDGDSPAILTLDLQPGSYLVRARERGVDVRVTLEAPGVRAEIEDNVPRHGLHAKVVSFAVPVKLSIELRNSEHRGKHGAADVSVARWRRESSEAGELELGYTAFGAAGEQTALGTKDSWTRAVDLLHESIAHFTAAGDDAARAQAEFTLANLEYLSRMEWQPAIRAADRARAVYADLDDQVGVHNAIALRAAAELEVAAAMSAGTQRAEQRSLYATADQALDSAAEYFLAQDLPLNAQSAINLRGIRAFYEGKYEEAGALLQRADGMARANADPGAEATTLINLAWIHNRMGFLTQAASEYERLLPLIEKDRQPIEYAALIHNYGLCLIALGDFDRALALHTEALQLHVKLNNDAQHAQQLTALGGLYFRTGELTRALETLRAAMAIQERVGDAMDRASTLRLAGNAASALSQHDLALQYLRKSVEIDVNPHSVARTRALIAAELRVLGDLRGAEQELARALDSDNALARATVLDERGRLRIAQSRYGAAIDDLRAADRQFADLGLDFNRIDTNTALSQALLATHDVAGAAASADSAIEIVRNIRVKSANPEWRAQFLSSRYSPYEARIAAEFAGKDSQASWKSFRIAEEVRARSLIDRLVDGREAGVVATDPAGDALRAKLTSQQLRLESRLQKADIEGADVVELRRAIVETRAQLDAHRAHREGVVANETKFSLVLADVQARVPADTGVLAYFVGDDATHAWLLTRERLRHAKLPGRASMQRLADAFVTSRRHGNDADRSDEQAADQLLGSLFADVALKRLLVVADGPLNGVPFSALPMPGSAKQLMVDRFVLGYSPSLGLALDGTSNPRTKATRVAVISDPVYAPDDQRLVIAARESGGTLRGPRAVSPHNLTRLPYSALEARTVAKVMGGQDTIRLEGFDANIRSVLGLAREKLAVLHFATHAVARRDLPEQSALYLTEYSPEGALLDDSRLTASEITRSGLRADVVVLSGCATGDGDELRGEGVLGLTYGFLANGSNSVVAALWPIEDASTARFMNEFYRAYRESGKTAEALRTAQLRTRASSKGAAWSSFVVRANGFP